MSTQYLNPAVVGMIPRSAASQAELFNRPFKTVVRKSMLIRLKLQEDNISHQVYTKSNLGTEQCHVKKS